MINKRNVWITLVFIGLDILCIKGLMIDIKDARFILGLLMCMFLTGAFARRIKIKPQNEIQQPEAESSDTEEPSDDSSEEAESSNAEEAPEDSSVEAESSDTEKDK